MAAFEVIIEDVLDHGRKF